MAWSDAARRASALVRRRMAEAKGRFHEYGTPKFHEHYPQQRVRKEYAQMLRNVRARARQGYMPTQQHLRDIDAAAYGSMMARHPTHPIRMTKLMAPDLARSTQAKYHPSGKERPALDQYKRGDSRKKLMAAARSSAGRIRSGRRRSRGRYA